MIKFKRNPILFASFFYLNTLTLLLEMDCFSSICPNDLLNNMNELGSTNKHITENSNIHNNNSGLNTQYHHHQTISMLPSDKFNNDYSSSFSSCSSSTSSSSSASPNLDDMKSSAMTYSDYPPCLLQNSLLPSDVAPQNSDNLILDSTPGSFFQLNNNNFKTESESLSSSSASPISSSLSSPSSTPSQAEYYTNTFKATNTKMPGIYQIQNININQPAHIIKTSPTNPASLMMLSTNNRASLKLESAIPQPAAPVLVSATTSSKPTLKRLTTNASSQKTKKNAILPPSPPSSFGSDSDSDLSTSSSSNPVSSTATKITGSKQTAKANKLVKQVRHQPYALKSTAHTKPSTKQQQSGAQSALSKQNNQNNRDASCVSDDDCWPFLCSLSKLPNSGPLLLTEEEKRTLVQEGHQVPTQLPLSKGEEKILKKIRRKIKNKISAQESRRKKKEYVDSLEKRMDNYINENVELKKRLEDLELNNKSLLSQLQKMQASLENSNQSDLIEINSAHNSTNRFGTLLMVLVLFFAVVLGVWSPVFTKDQMCHSAAAAAATAATSTVSARTTQPTMIGSSSSGVAAVAAVAAAVASVATVKNESLSEDAVEMEPQSADLGLKSKVVLTLSSEDELMSLDPGSASQISAVNHVARSKTGTAVELTKVRPFIRQLATIQKPAPGLSKKNGSLALPVICASPQSELVHDDGGQIIVLNLANSESSDSAPKTANLPVTLLGSKPIGVANSNGGNYRVVNSTSPQANPIGSPSKLATRFRVINNSNQQHHLTLNPSIIKLNSSSA